MTRALASGQTGDAEILRRRYAQAKAQRAGWDSLWQDCYDYALPMRRGNIAHSQTGVAQTGAALRSGEKLFDGTASDAADQLAASLLAQLTPPWSRWFAFQPGRDVPEQQHGAVAAELDAAAQLVQAQFDRSNLAVELNKIEAAHRSVFVAGWRPAVGWICAAAVAYAYLGHPLLHWAAALWSPGLAPPAIHTDSLFELVLAMLGMAGLRSFEKAAGRAK